MKFSHTTAGRDPTKDDCVGENFPIGFGWFNIKTDERWTKLADTETGTMWVLAGVNYGQDKDSAAEILLDMIEEYESNRCVDIAPYKARLKRIAGKS